jgi:hypothetical protein
MVEKGNQPFFEIGFILGSLICFTKKKTKKKKRKNCMNIRDKFFVITASSEGYSLA